MALIKCIECGKEFSDRALSCPNCGCPTSEILNAVKELEQKREIVATYKIGSEKILALTEKQKKYLLAIKKINEAKDTIKKVAQNYYNEYGNIDKVIDEFPEVISEVVDNAIKMAINTLNSYKIYDYDEEKFYETYYSVIDTTEIMEPLIDKYLQVMNLSDEVEKYHEYVKYVRRNSWSGGGFGVEGAIKGHIQAEMLNVGNVFLHSIRDKSNREEDRNQIEEIKKALYMNPDTLECMVTALNQVTIGVLMSSVNEIVKAGHLEIVSIDEERADILIGKYEHMDADINEQRELLVQAFFANPLDFFIIYDMLLFQSNNPSVDMGDIVQYAKDFEFYDRCIQLNQEYIRMKNKDEIENIEKAKVATNEEFSELFQKCIWLRNQEGYDTKKLINELISKRVKYSISDADKKFINDMMNGYNDIEVEKTVVNGWLESAVVNNGTEDGVKKVVKQLCIEYSKNCYEWDQDYVYLFDRNVDIRQCEIYQILERYIKELKKGTIFFVAYQETELKEIPKLIVIKDDSIIFWQEEKHIFLWKDFIRANITFEKKKNNLYINKELVQTLRDTPFVRFFDKIQGVLKKYFHLGKSPYLVSIDETTKKELAWIDQLYNRSDLSNTRKYFTLIQCNFESDSAKDMVQKKENDLINYITQLKSKTNIPELDIFEDWGTMIVSLVLGLFLLFKSYSWGALLGRFFAIAFLYGAGSKLVEIIKTKNKAEQMEEFITYEMNEFYGIFAIVDDHIVLATNYNR